MKLSNEERIAIYRRDGWGCAACGNSQYLQVHHIVRRGQGGSNDPRNLITLCDKCHATAHGLIYTPGFDADDMEQVIVEYMADYYASMLGEAWHPER